ncbi:MAG: RNA polymerase factor sigma-54, partial [Omnitrophica bacterium]|nr:RNA polymerase factor sigma-54 [Candidatus Omnitrophota bacterium]
LYEHLLWQLNIFVNNEKEKQAGKVIIGNLTKNGFLNMSLQQLCQLSGVSFKVFKRVLRLVRTFDPSGVAARNIKESLLIQLFLSGNTDRCLYRIIFLHLGDLEKGYFSKIANSLSISVEEVKRAKKRISYLNPNPAASFGGSQAVHIEPDIFFDKNNGTYNIEINNRDLPRMKVNHYYRVILSDAKAASETKKYIKDKFLGARWLINALRQRIKTIILVCEYLIQEQNEFLRQGAEKLKPLTLGDVAGDLSISAATVSRVVSNKYAQVSNRLIALKSFFSGKIETIDKGVISNRRIKEMILIMIEDENSKNPLTDSQIVLRLQKQGFNIARRTVSKYRENLGIQPFYLRKNSK